MDPSEVSTKDKPKPKTSISSPLGRIISGRGSSGSVPNGPSPRPGPGPHTHTATATDTDPLQGAFQGGYPDNFRGSFQGRPGDIVGSLTSDPTDGAVVGGGVVGGRGGSGGREGKGGEGRDSGRGGSGGREGGGGGGKGDSGRGREVVNDSNNKGESEEKNNHELDKNDENEKKRILSGTKRLSGQFSSATAAAAAVAVTVAVAVGAPIHTLTTQGSSLNQILEINGSVDSIPASGSLPLSLPLPLHLAQQGRRRSSKCTYSTLL